MTEQSDSAIDKQSLNFFGAVYPSYDHRELAEVFKINPEDKVLDIGGGHNPFRRADCIVDFDLEDGAHRDGQAIPQELKGRYIKADIHGLPFEKKSFDFVFCSHVLEHVKDPSNACKEIMRVGKRGYIEAPRKWIEIVAGYPSHQWLIDVIEGELIFEKRQFIESPYLNALLHSVWKNKKLEEYALRLFLNMSCVQFCWEGEFRFRIINSGCNGFDYSNPTHAALSHFCFARNILLLEAPLEHGIFHAEKAAMLCPDVDVFRSLCAIYSLLLNNRELWLKSCNFLQKRNIINSTDIFMVKLGLKKDIIKKLTQMVENYAFA